MQVAKTCFLVGKNDVDELSTHAVSVPLLVIFCQKEPGTKANKGAKGKKDEKQEAAKEGTTPSENGENKAEEVLSTHTSC